MAKHSPIHISAGTITIKRRGDRVYVLLLYRLETKTWHLPKGTRKPNETIKQTAIRETKEETGLDVTLLQHVGRVTSFFNRGSREVKKATYYYLAKPNGQKTVIKTDGEHETGKFIESAQAVKLLDCHTGYEKEHHLLAKILKFTKMGSRNINFQVKN